MDFNLYYLGFKGDSLRLANGQYRDPPFDNPQSISSAKSIIDRSDYFKLFDYQQPLYLNVLKDPNPCNDDEKKLSPEELRRLITKRSLEVLEEVREKLVTDEKYLHKDACKRLKEIAPWDNIFRMNGPRDIDFQVFFTPDWYRGLFEYCQKAEQDWSFDIVAIIDKLLPRQKALTTELLRFESQSYSPKFLADIKTPVLDNLFPTKEWTSLTAGTSLILTNSSTNYNRKRAAYVLKHYFCDDLTPINVEDIEEHKSGQHGSATSCYVCHYKLDPMAGFFRNHGRFFTDYSTQEKLIFDDGAQFDRQDYVQAWKNPEGSERVWNVGYIRSVKYTSKNIYGSEIQDLYAMLKSAPEVRSCLVRRMFEYFVAENQIIEPGFLQELTEKFNRDAESNLVMV